MYSESLHNLPSPPHRVAYSTFTSMWHRFLPQIMVTKPMSDLCWVCQKNSIAIMRAANHPEEQKSEVTYTRVYTRTQFFAFRSSRRQKSTSSWPQRKDLIIVQYVTLPSSRFTPTSRMVTHSLHLHRPLALSHVNLIWPSKYTILLTPSNQAPFIFLLPLSVPFLVYAARQFPGKSHI